MNVEHNYGEDIIPNMTRSQRGKYITYYEDSESIPGKRTAVWELDKGMWHSTFMNWRMVLKFTLFHLILGWNTNCGLQGQCKKGWSLWKQKLEILSILIGETLRKGLYFSGLQPLPFKNLSKWRQVIFLLLEREDKRGYQESQEKLFSSYILHSIQNYITRRIISHH